jgi:hypothetical protein
MISGWMMELWVLVVIGSRLGYAASLAVAALTGRRIARAMRGPETEPWDVVVVTGRGLGSAGLQLASAICRHYWPVALLAALLSERCRQAVLIAAITDGLANWLRHAKNIDEEVKPIGLASYLLLKRLDDLAYGAGLWGGVVRERNITPLKPHIRAR